MSARPGDYRVEFASSARRAIGKLPEKAAAACIELCFGARATDPHRVGKPLTQPLAGYYSARRGEYRVIYRISDADRSVHVVRAWSWLPLSSYRCRSCRG